MQLTNIDKLKRDTRSLLKARWDVDRITRHFVAYPGDYGTGLSYDSVLPIVAAECDQLNREAREARAELRAIIRATAADLARREPSMKPFLDTLTRGKYRIR